MKAKPPSPPADVKKKQKTDRWLIVFGGVASATWVSAFLFLWQAEKVSVIKGDALLMNAPWSLNGVAFIGSAASCIPFVCRFWSKSRWHGVHLTGLILGLGVVLAITQGGLCLNAWLDESAPQNHLTHVVDKKHIPGRNASWQLRVLDWRGSKLPVSLRSLPDEYEATPIGTRLVVTTSPGFFGWEWLVRRESTAKLPPSITLHP